MVRESTSVVALPVRAAGAVDGDLPPPGNLHQLTDEDSTPNSSFVCAAQKATSASNCSRQTTLPSSYKR